MKDLSYFFIIFSLFLLLSGCEQERNQSDFSVEGGTTTTTSTTTSTTTTSTTTIPQFNGIRVLVAKSLGFNYIYYWECSDTVAYPKPVWPGVPMSTSYNDTDYNFDFEGCTSVNVIITRVNGYGGDKLYTGGKYDGLDGNDLPITSPGTYRVTRSGITKETVGPTTTTTTTSTTTTTTVAVQSNQYFWGTWIKMSDGSEYEIDETSFNHSNGVNKFTSSTDASLSVAGFGTFTKESAAVMVKDNIPYYRKGGANLEYIIKVVGFVDSRAASSIAQRNKKVRGRSAKYTSFIDDTMIDDNELPKKTDENGLAKLIAPVAGDVMKVTVENDDGTLVTASDLKVEFNGANMGTIALVGKDQYNLKITGTIDDSLKTDGKLYINQEYPMDLVIKNISDVPSETFTVDVKAYKPSTNDVEPTVEPAVTIVSKDGFNLSGGRVGTLASGGIKTLKLGITCTDINVGHIDPIIKIKIKNIADRPEDDTEWEDCVPLRFHRGFQYFTVAAKMIDEGNTDDGLDSSLKGFIISPDGNGQYFSVANGGYKTIKVPEFNADEPYLMVFCGANANTGLYSTEMTYTVTAGQYPMLIDESDAAQISGIRFGEPNNTQETAYAVQNHFQAFLRASDIDYYKVTVNDDGTQPLVTLDNQGCEPPGFVLPIENGNVSNAVIPVKGSNTFGGYWTEPYGEGELYIDESGDWIKPVSDNITLYAKLSYNVEYYFQKVSGDGYEQNLSVYPNQHITGIIGPLTNVSAADNVTGFNLQPIQQEQIKIDGSTVVEVKYNRKTIIYTFNSNYGYGVFDGPGGTQIKTISGRYGASVNKPANPIDLHLYINEPSLYFDHWEPSVPQNFGPNNVTFNAAWR